MGPLSTLPIESGFKTRPDSGAFEKEQDFLKLSDPVGAMLENGFVRVWVETGRVRTLAAGRTLIHAGDTKDLSSQAEAVARAKHRYPDVFQSYLQAAALDEARARQFVPDRW